jgi:hypothetical protein
VTFPFWTDPNEQHPSDQREDPQPEDRVSRLPEDAQLTFE